MLWVVSNDSESDKRSNEMVEFVEHLKRAYPNPMKAQRGVTGPGSYCVGGAFCHSQGYISALDDFPNNNRLGWLLRQFNPGLMDGLDQGYCVGGTLCRELETFGQSFPARSVLARALRLVNNQLSFAEAGAYANSITYLNDAGWFEAAWDRLDEALTFKE
jgi:hypothetical protein